MPQRPTVDIEFALQFNGVPISCDSAAGAYQLTDLRFYVHNVELVAADGSRLPVSLEADGIWQNERVALIDLESGQGACQNGSAEMNAVIRGSFDGNPVEGLAFEIGVPESLNHADPMLAKAPLGYTEMHWHWASGYKFLRAGTSTENDNFFLHLGSSRCEGTIGNIKGCKSANRPRVSIDDFVPGRDRVVIDIGKLFENVDFADADRSECMSGPANEHCRAPFDALGVDFDTGESVATAGIFSAESSQ